MPHASYPLLPPLPDAAEHLTSGVNLLQSSHPRCIEVALVGPAGRFLARMEFPEALGLDVIEQAGEAALAAILSVYVARSLTPVALPLRQPLADLPAGERAD